MLELTGCPLHQLPSSASPFETSCLLEGACTVGRVRFRGHVIVESCVGGAGRRFARVVLDGDGRNKSRIVSSSVRACTVAEQRVFSLMLGVLTQVSFSRGQSLLDFYVSSPEGSPS